MAQRRAGANNHPSTGTSPFVETDNLVAPAAATAPANGAVLDPVTVEPWDGYENIFWQSEGEPDHYVTIRRLDPETWPHPANGRDVPVRGPLGRLPVGCNCEWIQANHGGGRFQLHAVDKETNRFIRGMVRTLYIPGAPLVRDPNTEALIPAGRATAPAQPAAPAFTNVGDQVIATTPDAWAGYIHQALATKKLLDGGEATSNLTGTLLQLLVAVLTKERQAADPFEQMLKMMELQERLRDAGGGNGESPFLNVIGKVADVASRMVQTKAPAYRPAPAAPALPGQPTAQLPQPEQPDGDNVFSQGGVNAAAREAVELIVGHYLASTDPVEVAEMLEMVVRIPKPTRAALLLPFKRQLMNVGKGMLMQQLEEPNQADQWAEYFYQVFGLFTGEQEPQQPETGVV